MVEERGVEDREEGGRLEGGLRGGVGVGGEVGAQDGESGHVDEFEVRGAGEEGEGWVEDGVWWWG